MTESTEAALAARIETLEQRLAAEAAEREIIAQQLASSEQQLRAILGSIMDAVLLIELGPQGISNIDIAPTHLSEYYSDRQHWLEAVVTAFFDPETATEWQAPIQQSLRQQTSVEADHALLLGEEPLWLAARITPLDEQRVVWVARDISDRKQAETALQAKNYELQTTLEQLQRTQAELIAAEKLAVLGQLVASIAHEINTPLGVISASIRHIQTYLQDRFWQWSEQWQQFTAIQQQQLQTWFNAAGQPAPLPSTRERRRRRKQIQQQLVAEGVEAAGAIAPLLIDLNQTDITPLRPLLHQANAPEFFQVAHQLGTVQTSIAQVTQAAARAAKIVQALRTYSRQSAQQNAQHNAQDFAPVELVATLETVLTLYQHQLKHDVEVVRNYGALPNLKVWGDRDQLHQVWSNLIRNALQAMPMGGNLTLTLKAEATTATLQITDTGTGISPELLPRIFEPFFTTRPAGEGTGLGLDITRKIIEQHQGQIQVTSQPGCTTFSIDLPRAPSDLVSGSVSEPGSDAS
ncbi:MAG: ATP-binding protein [Cyanobacteria bacterium P01_G01_bin.54]